MANPKWPQKKVNYRAASDGVECKMSTRLDIDLSVSVVKVDAETAEKEADRLIREKVSKRKSLLGHT